LKRLEDLLRKVVSRKDEKGEYSAGYWPVKVRNKLLELIPEYGSFLEIGCGEGLFLSDLRKHKPNLSLTGVDLWEEILNKAKARFSNDPGVKLVFGKGEKLPFADNTFDTAAAVNLLINIKGKAVLIACKETTWFLDLELIAQATSARLVVEELPIEWEEFYYVHRASKLRVVRDGLQALIAMMRIRQALKI